MDRAKKDFAIGKLHKALHSSLGNSVESEAFAEWHERTLSALGSIYGHESPIVERFSQISFSSSVIPSGRPDTEDIRREKQAFDTGCTRANAMLAELLDAIRHEPVDNDEKADRPAEPVKTRKQHALDRLERARASVPFERDASSEAFVLWREDVVEMLGELFGPNTKIAGRFGRIPYTPNIVLRTTGQYESAKPKAFRDGCLQAQSTLADLIGRVKQWTNDGPAMPTTGSIPSSSQSPQEKKGVFIVHGHDGALKNAVRSLVKELGLEPIILNERPDRGRTIIEKFEAEAKDAGYAVVLATADDLGDSRKVVAHEGDGSELKRRARQNVIYELGYFAGKLGRDRVTLVLDDGVELPSDFSGVVYASRHHWQRSLCTAIVDAGFGVTSQQMSRALAIQE